MKSLATLIKLQKTLVDEQRQHLSRLFDQLEEIDGKITQLEIRKAREQEAAKDNETRTTYGAFLQSMVAKGRALDKERRTAAQAVRLAQDKLSELFEEQKRYELAEAQRVAEELREENRLQRIDLDEIGAVIHERKRSE